MNMCKKGYKMSEQSKEKMRIAKKRVIPWNKGKKCPKLNEEHKKKIGLAVAATKNPKWKGDKVGYFGLHLWVNRKLGRPSLCESCKTKKAKKFEWANKSGEYKRDLEDWLRLCTSCHRKYDYSRVA